MKKIKIGKRFVHNLIFLAVFLCLDFTVIGFEIAMSLYGSVDDIVGHVITPAYCFGLYTPFIVAQLLYFAGSNLLFCRRLRGSVKGCILAPTVMTGWILFSYILSQLLTLLSPYLDYPRFIHATLNISTVVAAAWILMVLSAVMYVIGKYASDLETANDSV